MIDGLMNNDEGQSPLSQPEAEQRQNYFKRTEA